MTTLDPSDPKSAESGKPDTSKADPGTASADQADPGTLDSDKAAAVPCISAKTDPDAGGERINPSDAPPAGELKRMLRSEGFEIYRTSPGKILLAERVRDNLIMDSGVAIVSKAGFEVQVTVRAQASHFPGASAESMRQRAGELAHSFEQRGYECGEVAESQVPDPSNPGRSLDTSFEIALHRRFDQLEDVFRELKAALAGTRHTGED